MPRTAAVLATIIALLGWTALGTDFARTLVRSVANGQTLAAATFGYLRFFTILTNIAAAALMSATALRLWRRAVPPAAALFRAMLVYLVVTSLTYELLLRRLWSPRGVQYLTDLAFHDIVPGLFLIFWLGFAPKRDLAWRDLPWILVYPGAYYAVTLGVGAMGGGSPYNFLDAAMLGYPAVLTIGGVFLGVFLALGAVATAMAHATPPALDGGAAQSAPDESYQEG